MKISESARKELVRAYLEDGVPVRVLAEKLGCGTNTVYLHLYAAGAKGRRGAPKLH
jgi:transposase-like protein